MSRIKIDLPEKFAFSTSIAVRITDINYGGHVGNDALLGLLHEARLQFLQQYGYTEMKFEDVGLIMANVAIDFKNELFYGETVQASVTMADFTRVGFTVYYKLEKQRMGETILVAAAQTGMVCYDYVGKKIASVPLKARQQFE